MRFVPRPTIPMLLLLALAGIVACDDDPAEPGESFDLTFAGDDTFQGPHGGQTLSIAVVGSDGTVVGSDQATVAATGTSSFSFEFDDVLEEGESYEIHYWIDSNFGGGTAGTCDPPSTDHQWLIELGTVDDDVTMTDTHRPGETQSVCSTF